MYLEARMDPFACLAQRDPVALRALLVQSPEAATARNEAGASLLMMAAYGGDAASVDVLRDAVGDIDPWEAVILGDARRVTAALEQGWNSDTRSPDGFPPLALAVFFRQPAMVDVLLPLTTDVNARAENPQRVAALHAAVAVGDASCVERLLRAGADPNLPQSRDVTALHAASAHGNAVIAGLLVLFGADASAVDESGMRAADFAMQRGHEWLGAVLERTKADLF
jgi:ankyrin repeat protein